ncbi:reverse transcriptase domain-containing protein [Tanacetum coccineum]
MARGGGTVVTRGFGGGVGYDDDDDGGCDMGMAAVIQAMFDQGVVAALATRNANRSTNGEDNHNSGTGVRRTWFKWIETVFRISNCTVENQIKFSTCTLLGVALTWWKSHVRTVGHDVTYAMTWTDLKKKMTNKYCPRSEIKKLKVEL